VFSSASLSTSKSFNQSLSTNEKLVMLNSFG